MKMIAGAETDEQLLITLNREMGKAEKRRDEAFFRRVLADDLVFRRASGTRVTKQQYLADLIKPDNTYEFLYVDQVEVISRKDEALVSLLVWAKGSRGGQGFSGIFRNTRLFIKAVGNWQCAVWFNSREAP